MSSENKSPAIVRFGVFEADLRAGELRKQGVRVRLQEQPFQVLTVLLQRPGEVVTREELRNHNWSPDTFVDFDNSLNTAINKLREALGDSADNPRFIETLPRRGYRFIAPVTGADQKDSVVASPAAGGRAQIWRIILPAAVALVTAVVGGFLWRSRHQLVLTEKETIVLGDFANSTGDPVFDDTLRQGLRVQLEQTPFLNILSDQKVGEELRLMERPIDERLTPATAREVCRRTGSKAFVAGSISNLGAHYVVGLNAWNCESGDTLGSAQLETESKERVLRALSDAATAMRKKLGESLSTIQKYDAPLEATTPSLEALQAYSLGMKTVAAKGSAAAIPFFQRAVQLDPRFAMAYGRIGAAYSNIGEDASATENARRGYELREKASERERLYLESHYYDIVTGDLEKAVQVDELWHRTYPRDSEPAHNLIMIYGGLSKFDDAVQRANEALRLDSREADEEDFYLSIVPVHIFLNRFDTAEALLKEAREHKVESAGLLSLRYMLAFMSSDEREMEGLVASAAGNPRVESMLLDDEGCAKAYHGQLKQAREAFHKAIESAGYDTGNRELAAILRADESLTEAYLNDAQRARADADAALKLTVNRYVEVDAALALALAGETKRAEKLAAELNQSFPTDTELQRYWLPTIRAAAALQRGDAEKVADLLAPIGSYEITPYAFYFPLGQIDSTYVRGWASLALHNGSAATPQFRKILDHPGLAQISPAGALARLGLARAFTLQGDTAKAQAAYQDFLTLWKDADPDIPIFKEAKAEYAKLQ